VPVPGTKQGTPLVATACNEVEVSGAVIAFETPGHDVRLRGVSRFCGDWKHSEMVTNVRVSASEGPMSRNPRDMGHPARDGAGISGRSFPGRAAYNSGMKATAGVKKEEGARFLHYFGPLLEALRTLGGSGTPDEVVERIALDLNLPDELQNETLPSGESRFRNQVAWARFYLVREGLLDSSKRGVWSLTERGRSTKLSLEQAREIRRRWVRVFEEERRKKSDLIESSPPTEEESETVTDLQTQLITTLRALPAEGFERLSQRLLREAGFVQVVVTGRSGDGGIDGYGTLQVNPLVSFKVLFQCKRYTGSVSPSQVRDFRGAMSGRADKGIIITTGTFTAEARREASRDGVPPLELIDGEKLVEMFRELEFGLKPLKTFEIDKPFFEEFKR